MFRRSTVGLIVLLSSATAGAALAQSAAQPAKHDTTQKSAMHASHPAAAAAAKPFATPMWTKGQIKAAQIGLAKVGLYKGDTNGVMNGATRKALRTTKSKTISRSPGA